MSAQGSMTGRVFGGRYAIEDRIGIGGMAEVYRAQDNVLGRNVAVKVMLPQYAVDRDFTRRFRQEAAAAANLTSPYIVNVYDWGEDDGTYYIVMEYVRGSDLKTAVKQRGAINQRKVAEIGAQVCQALTVAHNLDIIHRDIKPQNIMIQPDGNIKVMDFGIAHAKNSTKEQTESVLGTANYISPEQAQGKDLTAASDIYSLGIVLYEAATGSLPFDGTDAVTVATKQVNERPVPPREINPNISPDLEAIIMCALSKNPADRFATANDMRQALNDFLAGRPVHLRSGTDMNSAETRVFNGVGAAPTVPVAPMGAPGMIDATQTMPSAMGAGRSGTGSLSNTTNYRQPEKKRGNGPKIAIIVVAIVAVLAVIGGIAFALLGGEGEGKPVPNVLRMPIEEATQQIENAGFTVGSINAAFDESVPVNSVISQDPQANSHQPEGTKINLVISQGVEQVQVPSLQSLTAEEARKAIEREGLIPSAGTPTYSDDVEKGHVISQNPSAGTAVNKGSTVEYVLSLGVEVVEIPDVVGDSRDSATNALRNSGFEVAVRESYSSSTPAGQVMSQDPTGGASIERGSTVTITVSLGPSPSSTSPSNPSGNDNDESNSSGGNTGDNNNSNGSGSPSGPSSVSPSGPSGSGSPSGPSSVSPSGPSGSGSSTGPGGGPGSSTETS